MHMFFLESNVTHAGPVFARLCSCIYPNSFCGTGLELQSPSTYCCFFFLLVLFLNWIFFFFFFS